MPRSPSSSWIRGGVVFEEAEMTGSFSGPWRSHHAPAGRIALDPYWPAIGRCGAVPLLMMHSHRSVSPALIR